MCVKLCVLIFDYSCEIIPLKFELNSSLQRRLMRGLAQFESAIAPDRLSLSVLKFERFGKHHLHKQYKISADAFLQMAFQLAYTRCSNKNDDLDDADTAESSRMAYYYAPSTYESCSTAHFIDGRTETIRSVSKESVKLTQLFDLKSTTVYMHYVFDILMRVFESLYLCHRK